MGMKVKKLAMLCVLLAAMLAIAAPAAAEGRIKLPKSDVPIMLEDAGSFDVEASVPRPQEVDENRRELASAVSAEKFVEGVALAIKLWWIF